ncbi:MAG: hypothetical protein KDN05_03590 [Verrucomicrobiae bacterium]|nr:hypothetical protein [Verrucomicrobiae bacterium]
MNRKSYTRNPITGNVGRAGKWMAAGTLAVILSAAPGAQAAPKNEKTCEKIARFARSAGNHEALDDLWIALGAAQTYPDAKKRKELVKDAREEYREARRLVKDQYKARLELCDKLGEARYHPKINPKEFLKPKQIAANPNPLFPLVPGTTYVYEGKSKDGKETIRVHVTDETIKIRGVSCIVVEDTVWEGDEVVEDTDDWYAQDKDGNVWYFGELTFEYEDGEIVGIEGSWKTGQDGAKPGIVMPAAPKVGVTYRQEFLLGEAEDAATVLALDEAVDTKYGSFKNCLKTADFTPIEPDALEHKFYAPGVGFVLETKPGTKERVELVSIRRK